MRPADAVKSPITIMTCIIPFLEKAANRIFGKETIDVDKERATDDVAVKIKPPPLL